MSQPLGFIGVTHPTHICKLHKAFYGLNKPHVCGIKSSSTQCILSKKYFLVYVDDLTITSNSFAFIAHFIVIISNQFSIKDLRFIHYFLRLKLYQPTMVSFYPNTNIFGISYSDITWIVPKMLHFLCLPHPHYVSMIISTC